MAIRACNPDQRSRMATLRNVVYTRRLYRIGRKIPLTFRMCENDDIKDVYGEAKGTGFDTKILRKIISIRKQDRDERLEQEAILETYMIALGMVEAPPEE